MVKHLALVGWIGLACGCSQHAGVLTPHSFVAQNFFDEAGRDGIFSRDHSTSLAVVSYVFPEKHALSRYLGHRSFIYDDALAVIDALHQKKYDTARAIGDTLETLIAPDGSIGYSFDVDGAKVFYNLGYTRSGAIAWVGYALARYEFATHEGRFARAIHSIARWLISKRVVADDIRYGLFEAGHGRWFHDWHNQEQFDATFDAKFCVTEHQIDVYFFFLVAASVEQDASLERDYHEAARALSERIMHSLWLADEGRFAAGVSDSKLSRDMALDAAGAWGSLFLLSIGKRDEALRALQFSRDHFRISFGDISGYRPFAGALTDNPIEQTNVLSLESTGSMAVALARVGAHDESNALIEQMQRMSTPMGVVFAVPEIRDFPSTPGVASTVWLHFASWENARELPVVFDEKLNPLSPIDHSVATR